jgi:Amt family ammonium transporter
MNLPLPILVRAALKNRLTSLVAEDGLWHEQLKAIAITLLPAVSGTVVVNSRVGHRPAPEVDREGLDLAEHGEEGYIE